LFELVGQAGDEVTADLLTQRLAIHEQTAWMLRALLED
jgi:starvation-inducible DNA-binding protein